MESAEDASLSTPPMVMHNDGFHGAAEGVLRYIDMNYLNLDDA